MHTLKKLSNGCYVGLTELPDKSIRIEAFRPAQIDVDGYEGSYSYQQIRFSREAARTIAKQILKEVKTN